MNPKILAVLLIALIFVQYSHQADTKAAKTDKPKADAAKPTKYDPSKPTPLYTPTTVAAAPAWGRGYGLPVDWNHDGIITKLTIKNMKSISCIFI